VTTCPRPTAALHRPIRQNAFRCNAISVTRADSGGDVVLHSNVGEALPFAFAGNIWDHAPPTQLTRTSTAAPVPEGMDVELYAVKIDASNATTASDACPNDRTAGPAQ